MKADEIADIRTQLERLRAHFRGAVTRYERHSFLDLAASLRVWLEPAVNECLQAQTYRYAVIPKTIKDASARSAYVFLSLADSLTLPSRRYAEASPEGVGAFNTDFLLDLRVREDPWGRTEFSSALLLDRAVSPELPPVLQKAMDNVYWGRAQGFSAYVRQPIVYCRFPDCSTRTMTTDTVIRRVANEYGGSHGRTGEQFNADSPAVQHLMHLVILEVPMPYIVCLHTAQTILRTADRAGLASV